MVPPDLIMMVVKSRGEIKNRTNFCRSSGCLGDPNSEVEMHAVAIETLYFLWQIPQDLTTLSRSTISRVEWCTAICNLPKENNTLYGKDATGNFPYSESL